MSRLLACPSCGVHVRAGERRCPFCAHELRDTPGRLARSSTAILMGLTIGGLSACVSQPKYGVPATVEPYEAPASAAAEPAAEAPAGADSPAAADEAPASAADPGDDASTPG